MAWREPRGALWLLLLASAALAAGEDAATALRSRVQPILTTRCGDCHGGERHKAGIDLTTPRDAARLADEGELWFRVLEQVERGTMPPADEPAPTAAERAAITAWIRGDLAATLVARQRREGRSRIRRLTRSEYANTVEDLFGIRPRVDLRLPEDGRADGYDKVAAALPLSADGAQGYLDLAEELLRDWILRPSRPQDGERTVRAAAMESGESAGHSLRLADGVTVVSFNSDTTSGRLDFRGVRVPGPHRIRASVAAYQSDRPLAFGVYTGNTGAYPQILELAAVLEAPPGAPAVVETTVALRAGAGLRLIPFGLGVQVPKNTLAKRCTGPGLAVRWVEIEGPELPLRGERWVTADLPPGLAEEMSRSARACFPPGGGTSYRARSTGRDGFLAALRATVVRIGARLWRRDLAAAEVDPLLAEATRRIDAGDALAAVFRDTLLQLLTSPDFLCVVEDPGELDDPALAARLARFLWSSVPDDALLAVARARHLRDPAELRTQTERMLRDPRAERFVADFADQWLGLRAIADTTPDRVLYPGYDELLRWSSVQETRGVLRRMLDEDLGVGELVAARWTMANAPLARLYGLSGVDGVALRRVELPAGSPYGGIWTQSAVMKVTANGTATTPVKRGRWVAERLLGTPIPPPPPDITPIEPDVRGATTLRERLALHRAATSCAACHARFDPYGFALESFDVVGAFRTRYREVDPTLAALPPAQRRGRPGWREGLPVDASGVLPDGQAFAGIGELRQLLAQHPERIAAGVARHLAPYATGAPIVGVDRLAIEDLVRQSAAQGYGLRSLVHGLVQSRLFRCR